MFFLGKQCTQKAMLVVLFNFNGSWCFFVGATAGIGTKQRKSSPEAMSKHIHYSSSTPTLCAAAATAAISTIVSWQLTHRHTKHIHDMIFLNISISVVYLAACAAAVVALCHTLDVSVRHLCELHNCFGLILMDLYPDWILPAPPFVSVYTSNMHEQIKYLYKPQTFDNCTKHIHMSLSRHPLVSVYTWNMHEQIKYLHSFTSLIIAKHNHMILSRQAKLYSVNPSILSGVTLSQTQSQIFTQFHHRVVIKLYMCTSHNICLKHKVTYLQSSMFDNCKTYDPPPSNAWCEQLVFHSAFYFLSHLGDFDTHPRPPQIFGLVFCVVIINVFGLQYLRFVCLIIAKHIYMKPTESRQLQVWATQSSFLTQTEGRCVGVGNQWSSP